MTRTQAHNLALRLAKGTRGNSTLVLWHPTQHRYVVVRAGLVCGSYRYDGLLR